MDLVPNEICNLIIQDFSLQELLIYTSINHQTNNQRLKLIKNKPLRIKTKNIDLVKHLDLKLDVDLRTYYFKSIETEYLSCTPEQLREIESINIKHLHLHNLYKSYCLRHVLKDKYFESIIFTDFDLTGVTLPKAKVIVFNNCIDNIIIDDYEFDEVLFFNDPETAQIVTKKIYHQFNKYINEDYDVDYTDKIMKFEESTQYEWIKRELNL